MITAKKNVPEAGQGPEDDEQFSNNTLVTVYIHRLRQLARLEEEV